MTEETHPIGEWQVTISNPGHTKEERLNALTPGALSQYTALVADGVRREDLVSAEEEKEVQDFVRENLGFVTDEELARALLEGDKGSLVPTKE